MQNIFFITAPNSKLSVQKEAILNVLEKEIVELRKIFDFSEFFAITVHNMPHRVIKEQGCGGYTPSAEWMQLYVDVDSELWGSEELLTNLKNTLVHEFSHTVRWATASYGYTLIETIVSEGLATAFEKEKINQEIEWGTYSKDEMDAILSFAKKLSSDEIQTTADHSQYLFGNDIIPKYFVYKLGTYIVEEFRKNNSGVSWSDLTRMDHKEILEKSKVAF